MGFVDIRPAAGSPLGGQTDAEVRENTWRAGKDRHSVRGTVGTKNDRNIDLSGITGAFTFDVATKVVSFHAAITGPYTSVTWDFGDTNTSTALNPIHTYATASTFTVTLTIHSDHQADVVVTHSVTTT